MSAVLLACVAMAFKDAIGTLLVIAEARGRAVLAGVLDAAGDFAMILVTLAGAGEVIVHGWTTRTAAILAAMMVTSFFGTILWTWIGHRFVGQDARIQDKVDGLATRVAETERQLGLS
jgi:hypothetical protein